jgi:hypothetical protein
LLRNIQCGSVTWKTTSPAASIFNVLPRFQPQIQELSVGGIIPYHALDFASDLLVVEGGFDWSRLSHFTFGWNPIITFGLNPIIQPPLVKFMNRISDSLVSLDVVILQDHRYPSRSLNVLCRFIRLILPCN